MLGIHFEINVIQKRKVGQLLCIWLLFISNTNICNVYFHGSPVEADIVIAAEYGSMWFMSCVLPLLYNLASPGNYFVLLEKLLFGTILLEYLFSNDWKRDGSWLPMLSTSFSLGRMGENACVLCVSVCYVNMIIFKKPLYNVIFLSSGLNSNQNCFLTYAIYWLPIL